MTAPIDRDLTERWLKQLESRIERLERGRNLQQFNTIGNAKSSIVFNNLDGESDIAYRYAVVGTLAVGGANRVVRMLPNGAVVGSRTEFHVSWDNVNHTPGWWVDVGLGIGSTHGHGGAADGHFVAQGIVLAKQLSVGGNVWLTCQGGYSFRPNSSDSVLAGYCGGYQGGALVSSLVLDFNGATFQGVAALSRL